MYKIIIDSCGELTDSLKKDGHFCNVALELDVDGYVLKPIAYSNSVFE